MGRKNVSLELWTAMVRIENRLTETSKLVSLTASFLYFDTVIPTNVMDKHPRYVIGE